LIDFDNASHDIKTTSLHFFEDNLEKVIRLLILILRKWVSTVQLMKMSLKQYCGFLN